MVQRGWAPSGRSRRTCIALSSPVFLGSFLALPFAMDWLFRQIYAFDAGWARDALGMSESMFFGLLMLVWLVSAYAIGRLAYMLLRWKRIVVKAVTDSGSAACPACFYDMIGNTSGICPECGTPCKTADPNSLKANG